VKDNQSTKQRLPPIEKSPFEVAQGSEGLLDIKKPGVNSKHFRKTNPPESPETMKQAGDGVAQKETTQEKR
jgi:hypothetical protein